MSEQFTKWVACWGNATSITDRRECVYAKDITLRYPVRMCFPGDRLRLRFSNLTGTEPVTLTRVFVALQSEPYAPQPVLFGGAESVVLQPGTERESDELALAVRADDMVDISIYLGECTQMNAGTLVTGPLSSGKYAYGDFAAARELPLDLTRSTNWFYFLNTIDIRTEECNHALICYGDSITAQSWPDYLTLRCRKEGFRHVSIIRRAVCGTRILRQYDCITYQAYGLRGATRFPIETRVSGASAVLIQHGINDIIHPVGVENNPFRPWSDMPTLDDLKQGYTGLYLDYARQQLGLPVYTGTLLPIYGWRTYNEDRDALRRAFNDWLRTFPCVDFDRAVCDAHHPERFAPGFDSGDHLHPSESAYEAMANCVSSFLLQ